MTAPERGKLIPVTGKNDEPDMENAIDVQFNPVTLKINLSNTLKASEQSGSSSAAQFVEKSSSSLSLELFFDTTRKEEDSGYEQGSDVRNLTGEIATQFIQPEKSGSDMKAPKRCLFQWGAFEFIGMIESYDETLDYFSPGGTPLRAKLALKLKEDRFQFRQTNDFSDPTKPAVPSLSPRGQDKEPEAGPDINDQGNQDGTEPPAKPNPKEQETEPVPGPSEGKNNWRETAEYNGIENPRMPGVSILATPTPDCQPRAGVSAALKGAVQLNANMNVNLNTSLGGKLDTGVDATASVKSRIKVDNGVGFE